MVEMDMLERESKPTLGFRATLAFVVDLFSPAEYLLLEE